VITLLLLLSLSTQPPNYAETTAPTYAPEVILGILSFDILYNGIRVGAFGSGHFYKGFLKGAALGACQFSAKLLAARQKTYETYPPIKTLFDVCNSMTDNLQDRIGLFDRINIPFGIGTYTWVHNSFGYVAINPATIGSIIDALIRTADFEVKKSLLTLTPVFSARGNVGPGGNVASGCYALGVIYLDKNIEKDYVQYIFNHELNHALFFSSFKHIDTAFDAAFNKYLFKLRLLKYIEVHELIMHPIFNIPAYQYRPQEIEAYTLTGPMKE